MVMLEQQRLVAPCDGVKETDLVHPWRVEALVHPEQTDEEHTRGHGHPCQGGDDAGHARDDDLEDIEVHPKEAPLDHTVAANLEGDEIHEEVVAKVGHQIRDDVHVRLLPQPEEE
eukprot:7382466-Prymnesium_polylepis.2